MAGNPYHLLLGVDPKYKTPNYFQILEVKPEFGNLEQFRADVLTGAQRQLEKLDQVPPGKHDPVVAQLKARIAQARNCLLNDKLRIEYVKKLNSKILAKKSDAVENSPSAPLLAPSDATTPSVSSVSSAPADATDSVSNRRPASPSAAIASDSPSAILSDLLPPKRVTGADLAAPLMAIPVNPTQPPAAGVQQPLQPLVAKPVMARPVMANPVMANPVAANSVNTPQSPGAVEGDTTAFTPTDSTPSAVEDSFQSVAAPAKVKIVPSGRRHKKTIMPVVFGFISFPILLVGFYVATNYDQVASQLGIQPKVDETALAPIPKTSLPEIASVSDSTDTSNDKQVAPDPDPKPGTRPNRIRRNRKKPIPPTPDAGNETDKPELPTTKLSDIDDPWATENNAEETDGQEVTDDPFAAIKSEPSPSEPISTEPISTEPKPTEPIPTEPSPTEPESEKPDVAQSKTFKLSPANMAEYRKRMEQIRRSMLRRDKPVVISQLNSLRKLLKLDDRSTQLDPEFAELETWVLATEAATKLLEGFWNQVVASGKTLESGHEIIVGKLILGFVEAKNDYVIIRQEGLNVTYGFEFLPAALAVKIAEEGAIENLATWKLQKSVLYALHAHENPRYADRVKEMVDEAEQGGLDGKDVLTFLNADVTAIGKPRSKIELPSKQELETAVADFRSQQNYQDPSKVKPSEAFELATLALDISPETPEARIAYLEETRQLAIEAGDAELVQDSILELRHWASIVPSELFAQSYLEIAEQKGLSAGQARNLMETGIPFLISLDERDAKQRDMQKLYSRMGQLAVKFDFTDSVTRLQALK